MSFKNFDINYSPLIFGSSSNCKGVFEFAIFSYAIQNNFSMQSLIQV